jgi:ParB-like chromosome segregation protein Spo0J
MAKGKGNVAVADVLNPSTEETVPAAPVDNRSEDDRIFETDRSGEMGAELEYHELANIFPAMSDDEYRALKLDIAANGQLVDIYTHEGKIIDGRHRYRATRELGIEPRIVAWDGEGSPTNFVVAMNLNRRHLSTSQRAAIALEILPLYEQDAQARMLAGKPTENLPEGEETNREDRTAVAQAGRAMNVSGKLVANTKKIQQIAPDLLPEIAAGRMTVNKALVQAEQRPTMPDGTPREIKPARAANKPASEERGEGALFELRDMLVVWLDEYSRISQLKSVTEGVKALLATVQDAESQNLDAGIDTSNPEASYDMEEDSNAEPTSAELASIENE